MRLSATALRVQCVGQLLAALLDWYARMLCLTATAWRHCCESQRRPGECKRWLPPDSR